MPGLSFCNELISCDKGLHCNFALLLYSKLLNRLPEARVIEIINSVVNIGMEFVVDALPIELIGMNSSMMCNYIKFCADRLLIAPLGTRDTIGQCGRLVRPTLKVAEVGGSCPCKTPLLE